MQNQWVLTSEIWENGFDGATWHNGMKIKILFPITLFMFACHFIALWVFNMVLIATFCCPTWVMKPTKRPQGYLERVRMEMHVYVCKCGYNPWVVLRRETSQGSPGVSSCVRTPAGAHGYLKMRLCVSTRGDKSYRPLSNTHRHLHLFAYIRYVRKAHLCLCKISVWVHLWEMNFGWTL